MRIAFVSLYDFENNAVRQLAHFLRTHGHDALEVYFKDWKNNGLPWPTEKELADFVRGLKRFDADVVGFSLRASAYLEVCAFLANHVREQLGVPVLLGGVHASLCPESCTGFADYVARGEAEQAIVELLDRMEAGEPTEDVENFWVKRADGEIRQNDLRHLTVDLAQVSRRDFLHPDKLIIDEGFVSSRDPLLNDTLYLVMASRGCLFHCSFCYNSTMRELFAGKGRYYRTRTVDDVLSELREAKQVFPRLKRIRFDDEVMPTNGKWLDELAERYPEEVGLPFECFLEPRIVEEDRLRKLVDAGLDTVYMGVQANDRVAKTLYDRRASNEGILETAQLYNKLGLEARFQVMVDDPVSTEEDMRALFDLINQFPRPFRLYLFSMTVMPGTGLEKKLLDQGLITEDEVEGAATKTFYQYRVSLDWDRDATDKFWVALMVMVNKPWFPAKALHWASRNDFLKTHPDLLANAASASNMLSMAGRIPRAINRGEVGLRVIRRFWTPGKWITA